MRHALSALVLASVLGLALNGCGKTITETQPAQGPGLQEDPNAGSLGKTSTKVDTGTQTDVATSVVTSITTGTTTGSDTPPQAPTAEKCDADRSAARAHVLSTMDSANLLARSIDLVYSKLDKVDRQKLQADFKTLQNAQSTAEAKVAARERVIRIYTKAMQLAGMKTIGQVFANVSTGAEEQSYVGVYPKGATMSSVKRMFTGDNELSVLKLNWTPGSPVYMISVQQFPVARGTSLEKNGEPRQDIQQNASFEGSLLRYIETKVVAENCKGLTKMTETDRNNLNRVTVGATLEQ